MSGSSKLTDLQWRILELLSGLEPSWTLTGGGALAGFHLKHRTTRDLDLFWHGRDQLDMLPEEVRNRLARSGLAVTPIQSGSTFARCRVSDEGGTCIVDMVADPVGALESPIQMRFGSLTITVDTPHEILVNKLCALLGRSEIRDLEDIEALLESGADLERALQDAPRKDGGFSPLTLAWVLKELQPRTLAQLAGLSSEQADRLESFKARLLQRLLESSAPS